MAIKLVDELKAMGNFPIAHAEGINLVKTDGTEDNLQNLFDNGELIGGGGDSSVTLTQQEYEALSEEQKLGGLYYTYDTKRIYKNGVQYGASDAEGIGYNNAESGIQATTVQGAIDKVVKTVEDTYAKTTDIPTTLPANGGNADTVNNHTVKSDVPENAVFTDTIYDDTEVKGKLNGLINDTKVTTTNTFSSDKIKAITNEIRKFILSKTDYQGIEAYPTECGVYRVTKKIDGTPNDASQYAALIIYGNGYFTHIYHDAVSGRMWIGYTSESVKPPTWQKLVTKKDLILDADGDRSTAVGNDVPCRWHIIDNGNYAICIGYNTETFSVDTPNTMFSMQLPAGYRYFDVISSNVFISGNTSWVSGTSHITGNGAGTYVTNTGTVETKSFRQIVLATKE